MIRHDVIKRFPSVSQILSTFRNCSSSVDLERLERESPASVDVIDEEVVKKNEEIELKRNKSRLRRHDYNILHGRNPYPQPANWHHGTIKYMRRIYGQYGAASGVNPAICWPIKTEMDDKLEYEKIAYPFTIPEMMETAKKQRAEKDERIRLRQEDIVKKMAKLEDWKRDLKAKVARKEKDVLEAKQRKERLVEEVRAHFGYTVDPKDEKFQQLIEKKEKEEKKALKAARKKEKEDKLMAKLLSKKDSKEQKEPQQDKKPEESHDSHEEK